MAPRCTAAKSIAQCSGRLEAAMSIRSPRFSPAQQSPYAAASTSSASSRHVQVSRFGPAWPVSAGRAAKSLALRRISPGKVHAPTERVTSDEVTMDHSLAFGVSVARTLATYDEARFGGDPGIAECRPFFAGNQPGHL